MVQAVPRTVAVHLDLQLIVQAAKVVFYRLQTRVMFHRGKGAATLSGFWSMVTRI